MRPYIGIFLVCALSTGFAGQGENQPDVLSAFPKAHRSEISKRLELVVRYQREKDWAKLYDLLSPLYTQGESKGDYMKRHRKSGARGLGVDLVEFTPQESIAEL